MGWLPLVMDPAGANARHTATLAWLLISVVGIVFLLVCAALAVSIFGTSRWKAFLARRSAILAFGFATPAVVLACLLAYSLMLTTGLSAGGETIRLKVRVTGEMWWWRVAYLDDDGRQPFMLDANELHIPAGQSRRWSSFRSNDVIHSFWVPQPRRASSTWSPAGATPCRISRPTRPGVYAGQCAEYLRRAARLDGHQGRGRPCPVQDFDAWLRHRGATPCAAAIANWTRRGGELVPRDWAAPPAISIRGTPTPTASAGPDLTHVGARRSPRRGHPAQQSRHPGGVGGTEPDHQARQPNAELRDALASGAAGCSRVSRAVAMTGESGFDASLYNRFPTEGERPPGERERLEAVWRPPNGWRRLTAVNNSYIGFYYLATAFLFFILAGVLALVMRVQLAAPAQSILPPEIYNQFFTMHGTVMMFLFAVPVVEASGCCCCPRCWARATCRFPRLSAYAFWAYAVGGLASFARCSSASPRMAAGSCTRPDQPHLLARHQCRLLAARDRLHRDLRDRRRDRDHRRRPANPRPGHVASTRCRSRLGACSYSPS
jgi:heme/copper-type cytochrome/quinol oxidase subunit 2